MLLYRFDQTGSFPILESLTTARRVRARMDTVEEREALWLTVNRERGERGELAVTLGLPPRSIDGRPEALRLELDGDAGNARVFLEAAEACGVGVVYSLGTIDGPGLCVLSASLSDPLARWDGHSPSEPSVVTFPIQLQRLRIVLDSACPSCDIGLISLQVTGQVRLAATGIA